MPKDILLDENFEAVIKNGDLVIGESTYQQQQILIMANKGEFKSNPKTGVGAIRFVEQSDPNNFAREIRQEFISDGMKINEIKIADNLEITVDANY